MILMGHEDISVTEGYILVNEENLRKSTTTLELFSQYKIKK